MWVLFFIFFIITDFFLHLTVAEYKNNLNVVTEKYLNEQENWFTKKFDGMLDLKKILKLFWNVSLKQHRPYSQKRINNTLQKIHYKKKIAKKIWLKKK